MPEPRNAGDISAARSAIASAPGRCSRWIRPPVWTRCSSCTQRRFSNPPHRAAHVECTNAGRPTWRCPRRHGGRCCSPTAAAAVGATPATGAWPTSCPAHRSIAPPAHWGRPVELIVEQGAGHHGLPQTLLHSKHLVDPPRVPRITRSRQRRPGAQVRIRPEDTGTRPGDTARGSCLLPSVSLRSPFGLPSVSLRCGSGFGVRGSGSSSSSGKSPRRRIASRRRSSDSPDR